MLLAIDAGNTNIVFAVLDGEAVVGQWRMATEAQRTADEYGIWLLQVLERARINPADIDAAILSSVVPRALFALRTLCRHYFNCEVKIIGEENVRLNMPVKLDRPSEVGSDRIVNAIAAWKKYNRALVIVDFGTATTFDVVSSKGEYIGGVIAPGIQLSLETLHKAAAKLPSVPIEKPQKVIGTGTVSAMQSGIFYGYLSLIEGILERIKKEYGEPMLTIATGGLAPLYASATSQIEELEPDLTIMGLRHIYEMNK